MENIVVVVLVVLGVVAAVVAPTALVGAAMRRRAGATRSPDIEAQYAREGLKVTADGPFGTPVVTGTLEGTPFVLELTVSVGSVPEKTLLSIDAGRDGAFKVTREGSRDLSGRDRIAEVFPDASSRDAVRGLFALGYDTVELRRGKLCAIRYLHAALPHAEALRKAVGQLSMLRETRRSAGG